MKISLKNYNSGSDFQKNQIEFDIFMVVRDNEIIIVNEEGKEIANLKCSAMTDSEDKYINGFWLEFNNNVPNTPISSNMSNSKYAKSIL